MKGEGKASNDWMWEGKEVVKWKEEGKVVRN